MKISVLCSDSKHPVGDYLTSWMKQITEDGHEVSMVRSKKELSRGDILFLVSCSEIINETERDNFKTVLVLHASNLPLGRGWNPYIWEISRGAREIHLCLLEAQEPVDSGDVWFRDSFELEGHELLTEIHDLLFRSELRLMTLAVDQYGQIEPQKQTTGNVTYYRKRTPDDSVLDPNRTIAEQFNLLRSVDSDRFPAFFDHMGYRYILKIEKAKPEGKERERRDH